MEPEKDYPYTSGTTEVTGTCKFDAAKVVVHINGFAYATTTGNETQMTEASYKHGPLSICVDASTWQYYTVLALLQFVLIRRRVESLNTDVETNLTTVSKLLVGESTKRRFHY